MPEPPPKAWGVVRPAEGMVPTPQADPNPEPAAQEPPAETARQYGAIPSHGPSAAQLLAFAMARAAEQAALASAVEQVLATAENSAWCSTDGAVRLRAWRTICLEGVRRSCIAADYLAGVALE